MIYSGYIINYDILLATDIEAARESARFDEKRKARKAKKAEKWRARKIAEARGFAPRAKRCGRRGH